MARFACVSRNTRAPVPKPRGVQVEACGFGQQKVQKVGQRLGPPAASRVRCHGDEALFERLTRRVMALAWRLMALTFGAHGAATIIGTLLHLRLGT